MGTVTFLFSDIEGSTRLVAALEPLAYRDLLELHHARLRAAFARHGGVERGTQGDAFLVVFADTPAAVAAAVDVQRALAATAWPGGATVRVRIGPPHRSGDRRRGRLRRPRHQSGGSDRRGRPRWPGARLGCDSGPGEPSLPGDVSLLDLGKHRLKDLARSEHIFQLVIGGLPASFPPLRSLQAAEGNVPVRLTSFVGRVRELDELAAILDDARLVTLTGPGGTGKSSLAVSSPAESRAGSRTAAGSSRSMA